MSLVERLAWKWDDAFAGQEYPDDDPERHEVAKADALWWLDAIADEVDGELQYQEGHAFARWLRSQATSDSDTKVLQNDVLRHSTIPKSDSAESD